jgi:hypothetical protein
MKYPKPQGEYLPPEARVTPYKWFGRIMAGTVIALPLLAAAFEWVWRFGERLGVLR